MSDFELLFPNSCCELGQLIPYAFIFSKNICNADLDIDQHFVELLKACFGGGDFGSCDRWFFSCKLLIVVVCARSGPNSRSDWRLVFWGVFPLW